MSRDLGRDVPDLEKLHARKLWADFSYLILLQIFREMPALKSPNPALESPKPALKAPTPALKHPNRHFFRAAFCQEATKDHF